MRLTYGILPCCSLWNNQKLIPEKERGGGGGKKCLNHSIPQYWSWWCGLHEKNNFEQSKREKKPFLVLQMFQTGSKKNVCVMMPKKKIEWSFFFQRKIVAKSRAFLKNLIDVLFRTSLSFSFFFSEFQPHGMWLLIKCYVLIYKVYITLVS